MGTPLDAVEHGLNQLRIHLFDKNRETINEYNCLLHFGYLVADEQVAIATDRPANLGERYERGPCELSPQSTAWARTTITMNISTDSALHYWHAHDVVSLPFTHFWLMLACYQVDHELTDSAMATELMLDHKTVGSWRKFIVNDSVLQKILERIAHRGTIESSALRRLDKLVREQLADVQTVRLTVPGNRTDARLPSEKKFSEIVTAAIPTVIAHWVRVSRDQEKLFEGFLENGWPREIAWGNTNAKDAAAKVASSLIRSYSRPSRANDSETLRLRLLIVLGQVAQSEVQMAALRVLSILPSEKGVDSTRTEEFELLESRVPGLRAQAVRIALAYEMKLLEEVAEAERIDEEDATHGQAPVAAYPAAASPQSFAANVTALMDCLAKLQSVPR